MKTANPKGIYARYYPLKKISVKDIQQMYTVFQRYYENTDVETFLKDLSGKSGAILVRTKDENRVVGFSTIVSMDLRLGQVKGKGVFSGDTIIEREYWGTRTLQLCFYRYVMREKLLAPHKPVFWLLISKGYKTYLLLANNFKRYYPNPDNRHTELDKVVRFYCDKLFPGHFDSNQGLLNFGDTAQRLRGEVAGISDELRERYPKIRYFETKNPTWTVGTELPCVGVVCSKTLTSFALKAIRKPFTRTARSAI